MNEWICECGKANDGKFCIFCGRKKPEDKVPEEWKCSCGAINKGKFCSQCGSARPSVAEDASQEPENISENQRPAQQNNEIVPVENKPVVQSDEIVQVENHPEVQDESREYEPAAVAHKAPNKKTMAIILAIIVLVAAYFGYNKYLESQYDSHCQEFNATITEMKTIMVDVGNLSGDPDEEGRQKAIDTLKGDVDKLKEINEYFQTSKLPDKASMEKAYWVGISDKMSVLGEKTLALLEYNNRVAGPTHKKHLEEIKTICKDFNEAKNEVNHFLDNNNSNVDGKSARDFLELDKIEKGIDHYLDNKYSFDSKKVEEDAKKYQAKLKESNDELLKKQEVVFLIDRVYKDMNNTISISGHFHNNTGDVVSGIQGMLIDVTLKNGDEEVFSQKDYQDDANNKFENLMIPANGDSWPTYLQVKSDIKDIDFDNFEASVHKIKWKVRKLVKK